MNHPDDLFLRRSILTLSLAVALLSGGCRPDPGPVDEVPVPTVRVEQIHFRTVRPVIETFGTAVQVAQTEVFPTSEAIIESIFVEEGDSVSTGMPLAVLRSDRIRLSLDQAAAMIESKDALEALAREQLSQGRRSVETQLIMIEKTERELAQKTEEYHAVRDLLEKRRQLFDIGGVAEGDMEVLRTQYLRARTEMEQVSSDLRIRTVGFRDQDILAAGLALPTNETERTLRLIEINTASLQAQLDVAGAERSTAGVELRRVEKALAETVVRSPIDGVVALRSLDVGSLARPQNPMFSIMDVGRVVIQSYLGEDRMSQVEAGIEARITIGRDQEAMFSGHVATVSPFIDTGSRTVRIRTLVENPDRRFVPGMFSVVHLYTGAARRAAIVPLSALTGKDPPRIFLVREERLLEVEVRVIESTAMGHAVIGPIADDDQIAVDAHEWFHNGMRVNSAGARP